MATKLVWFLKPLRIAFDLERIKLMIVRRFRMIKKISVLTALLLAISLPAVSADDDRESKLLKAGFKVEEVSAKALAKWQVFGNGQIAIDHTQLLMSEKAPSVGLMLVNPKGYQGDVIISYDVMVMRPATVMVTNLASTMADGSPLIFPDGYDAKIKWMWDNMAMYNLVYHDAAHNRTGPLFRRIPEPGKEILQLAEQQFIQTGIYQTVEAGAVKGRVYLKLGNDTVLHYEDVNPLKGGKIIIRIRGTGHEIGSALIRNVKIYSREE